MNDIVQKLAHMLSDDGAPCDFGLQGQADQLAIEKAKAISNKPICLVKEWVWWDLQYSEKHLHLIKNQNLLPCLIYSQHVIYDELGRFQPGNQMRSSMLIQFHEPGFFETANSLYILIGSGTRKPVDPMLVAQLTFDN